MENCKDLERIEEKRLDYLGVSIYSYRMRWEEYSEKNKNNEVFVNSIKPEDNLNIWLPRWIDYMVTWYNTDSTDYEKFLGCMSFKIFISVELDKINNLYVTVKKLKK